VSDSALDIERRRGPDRRRRPTPILSRYTIVGRRRAFRREEEGGNAYVDRYSPRMAAALVAIMVLCVLDALFTLLYLQRGGTELNPLMAAAIEMGVVPFLAIKNGLTIVGVLFLCLHKNFRHVKPVIAGVLVLYTLLMAYHLYLTTV
jgi:hypothetical protein